MSGQIQSLFQYFFSEASQALESFNRFSPELERIHSSNFKLRTSNIMDLIYNRVVSVFFSIVPKYPQYIQLDDKQGTPVQDGGTLLSRESFTLTKVAARKEAPHYPNPKP